MKIILIYVCMIFVLYVCTLYRRLNSIRATNSGKAVSQNGTTFIQRNLKCLPKQAVGENLRSIKGMPKMGVNWVGFDPSNYELLAVHDETYPRCMWVWNAYDCKLINLTVLMESIVCMRWRPRLVVQEEGRDVVMPSVLAMCTGTSRVYFWTSGTGKHCNGHNTWADLPLLAATASSIAQTKAGATGVASGAAAFGIYNLRWSSDGQKLLLVGRDTSCTCEINYVHCRDEQVVITADNNSDSD